MIQLSEDQWNKYLKKYKNLMWKISHMISGDPTISSLEDNYADIMLAALESINGFNKKTGMSFDEMFTTKFFDQYTKTCLWTAKARKGNGIKKNYPVTNRKISIAVQESDTSSIGVNEAYVDTIEGKQDMNLDIILAYSEIFDNLTDEDTELLKVISDNPDVISFSGKLRVKTLAKKSKLSLRKVEKILDNLRKKVNYDLE